MERRKFLAFAASITGTASLYPTITKANSVGKKGFKTLRGEGRIRGHMHLKGVNENILDIKISGADTDGHLAIFEQTSLSQNRGVPLHVHLSQDESFYVIEGLYFFQVGDDQFKLEAGDTIFLPANVPHSWIQLSAKGKMIVTFQPAGLMEEFFAKISGLASAPTPQEMATIFAEHGMKIVGPPVKYNPDVK